MSGPGQTAPAPGVSGRALYGHLELRCERRADGVPYLSRQSFRAPIHLSKTHLDQGALIVHLVNPTAGFFDGDRLALEVEAGRDVHLALSTPGASRVHRARSEAPAVCEQRLRVEEGAFVEWLPEPFIPQAGARYLQRTDIELATDAGLLLFEWIAPGRVAKGEIFAYRHLRWELDLRVNGRRVARERYDLRPEDESLTALRARFPAAHHVTAYVAGVRDWPAEELDAMSDDKVYLGHGGLLEGVRWIRALCVDSLAARGLLERLRPLLLAACGRPAPRLGRIFW